MRRLDVSAALTNAGIRVVGRFNEDRPEGTCNSCGYHCCWINSTNVAGLQGIPLSASGSCPWRVVYAVVSSGSTASCQLTTVDKPSGLIVGETLQAFKWQLIIASTICRWRRSRGRLPPGKCACPVVQPELEFARRPQMGMLSHRVTWRPCASSKVRLSGRNPRAPLSLTIMAPPRIREDKEMLGKASNALVTCLVA
jgi:hypothetical protein